MIASHRYKTMKNAKRKSLKVYGIILALLCNVMYFCAPSLPVYAATTYMTYGGASYPVVDGEIILAYIGETSQIITHLHSSNAGLTNDVNYKASGSYGCFTSYHSHSHSDGCYDTVALVTGPSGWMGDTGSMTQDYYCSRCGTTSYYRKSFDRVWHADSYVEGTTDPNAPTGHYEYYSNGVYGHHRCGLHCGLPEGTYYTNTCGLSTSTVVATINARLDETTGEMVFSVKGPSGTVADYADDVTWTVKAYEMDEKTLCETVTLSGDTVRKAIEYPKYAVTCSFKDKGYIVRSYTIPTFIASIYNLYYNATTVGDANAKPLNVYLNGVKLRAVYMNGTSRDNLMFGY